VKIGFNMLLWGPSITLAHRRAFEALKAAGYDGVEIPVIAGRMEHYEALAAMLDDIGLERTTLTVLPHGGNPLSSSAGERQAGLDHLKWALDCSAAMGSKLLVGPIHQTLGVFTGLPPSAAEFERGCAFHRAIGDHAAQRRVRVAIEAMNRFEAHFVNTMAQLTAYLDRVGHPAITGMFDTFHANIEELDPAATIAPSIRHIAHVHISENDRGVPGRGHVAWRETFRALRQCRYDGWLTIEAFGRASPEFAAKTRVWREFADTPEAIYREGFAFIQSGWAAAAP
jgi:D-psicose/D-tagatose/L-ribulose 3-epimerase